MGHTDRTAQSETSDQSRYVIRAGELAHDSYELDLTPERAGWEWSSLRVVALAPGKSLTVPAGEHEYLVLPLSGGCTVQAGGERLEVAGRESVFTDITDYVYVPRRTEVTLTSAGGARIALPGSKATADKPLRYCPRSEVGTGLRGAGPSSRQVNNYALGNDVETSHLLAGEVLTPGGNWSSIYPSPGHDIDVCTEVRGGDVVVMPYGYHGPSVAAPGYDLYYLNVMAGPAEDSVWLMTDDPHHTWVRQTWEGQEVDPRLPMTPMND